MPNDDTPWDEILDKYKAKGQRTLNLEESIALVQVRDEVAWEASLARLQEAALPCAAAAAAHKEVAEHLWPCKTELLRTAAEYLGSEQAVFRGLLLAELLGAAGEAVAADEVVTRTAAKLGYKWTEAAAVALRMRRALGPAWRQPREGLPQCAEEYSMLRFMAREPPYGGAYMLERKDPYSEWPDEVVDLYGGETLESWADRVAGEIEVATIQKQPVLLVRAYVNRLFPRWDAPRAWSAKPLFPHRDAPCACYAALACWVAALTAQVLGAGRWVQSATASTHPELVVLYSNACVRLQWAVPCELKSSKHKVLYSYAFQLKGTGLSGSW